MFELTDELRNILSDNYINGYREGDIIHFSHITVGGNLIKYPITLTEGTVDEVLDLLDEQYDTFNVEYECKARALKSDDEKKVEERFIDIKNAKEAIKWTATLIKDYYKDMYEIEPQYLN
jgi:hypothetical protein